jgi:hypothetical protein
MRNAVIHDGGRMTDGLLDTINSLSPPAVAGWIKLSGADPTELLSGTTLRLGHGEMLLGLAVTKRVDRDCNGLLQQGLPRRDWARIAVDDALLEHPSALRAANALRKCHGVARHLYAPLGLTREEVAEALRLRA